MKGLNVSIYRFPLGECTNGGVTAHKDSITLVGEGIAEIFETEPEQALTLVIDWEPQGCAAGHLNLADPRFLKDIGRLSNPMTDWDAVTGQRDSSGLDWVGQHEVCRVRAVPLNKDGQPRLGGMSGGNYIECSDARFPMANPIKVFDRFE